jgi:hypothetical protein
MQTWRGVGWLKRNVTALGPNKPNANLQWQLVEQGSNHLVIDEACGAAIIGE